MSLEVLNLVLTVAVGASISACLFYLVRRVTRRK